MPGLDARRLRRLLAARETPAASAPTPAIYLLGGTMRPRDVRAGAGQCLRRPFSPRLLVDRVLSALPSPERHAPHAPHTPAALSASTALSAPEAPEAPSALITTAAPIATGSTGSIDSTASPTRHRNFRRPRSLTGHLWPRAGPGHAPGPDRGPGHHAHPGRIRPAVGPGRARRPGADPGSAAGRDAPAGLRPGGGRAHCPAPCETVRTRADTNSTRRRLHPGPAPRSARPARDG